MAMGSTPSTPAPEVPAPSEPSKYYCYGMTPADIQYVIQIFASTVGQKLTPDDVCRLYDPNYQPGSYPGGSSGTGSGSYSGNSASIMIRKDTCGAKSSANYFVRVDLNLAGVDPQIRANGFEIQAAVLAQGYKGSRAASLKPESDGKFAPRPLLLLSTTGGYLGGNESAAVVRWSRGKVKSVQHLRVEDYVGWQGKVLARIVAPPLNGGKAVVELSSKSAMYSVCFQMVRKRQRYNGY
jgi:hypothetical protein